MSAVLEALEPSAPYLAVGRPPLVEHFELLLPAEGGTARLRQLILALAVQGKLVQQDPSDEPASELLKRIRAAKPFDHARRDSEAIPDEEFPFQLPSGWAWSKFGEYVLELCTGPFGSLIHKEDYVAGGVPLINPSHMIGGQVVHDDSVSVPHAMAMTLDAYRLRAGDVLLARRGEVGRYALVTDRESGWLCGTGSFFVKMAPDCDRRFFGLLLDDPQLRRYLLGESVGTTMTNLNQRILLQAVLGIPPLAEQARIVARVDELIRLCDDLEAKSRLEAEQHARLLGTLLGTLTESTTPEELVANWQRVAVHFDLLLDRLEAVDALEQTILQLAVRGLLAPQDPSDDPASAAVQRIQGEVQRLSMRRGQPRDDTSQLSSDLFALPAGWLWCTLEDLMIAGPTNGLSPKPVDQPTDIRCLSLSATTSGRFRSECFKYVNIPIESAIHFWLKKGDLLLQRGNSLDYVGIAAIYDQEDDEYIYPDLMIKVRLSAHVDTQYVHMWLICRDGRAYFQRNASGTQGTMPKINQSVVRAVPIPLPPLNEQRRIVARVTELRRLCATLRERLATQQTVQSQLADALVEQALA